MTRKAALTFPPRLVSREAAAAYVGIGATKFDELVQSNRMPPPKRIDARKLWDLRQLDAAVDELPVDGETAHNPWDNP